MTWPAGADPLAWAEAYLARQWTPLPIWPLVAQADRLVCTCWAGEGCASPGKHPRVPWRHLDCIGPGQVREWWGRACRRASPCSPLIGTLRPESSRCLHC